MEPSTKLFGPEDYGNVLQQYLEAPTEKTLYAASAISQALVESGLGPEDVVALHFESLQETLTTLTPRRQAHVIGDAHQFLLDVMIAYGVKFKEYLELKLDQAVSDAEVRAARARERSLEMERVQREEREILARIAHELRSPITAARGQIDLATRALSQGKVEAVPRLLGTAREALDRLSRLSADLVEASRGEAPTLELAPQNLNDTLEQACRWAQPTAAAKGVELRFTPSELPCFIHANSDALLSIFGNLLANAIRYTPSGGEIQVECGVADDWVVGQVRDTGIGMEPEVVARIFDRFYRGPSARRIEARGLGLGLALVQQMVAGHGGRIEVESAPGQGSSFRIMFPKMAESPSVAGSGNGRSEQHGD
jgi:signal transduction histidine kinase